jgi:hypothetical protein
MAPTDRIRLPFRWRFVPISDPRDKSIHWLWHAYTQTGDLALESDGTFESLTECMNDAKAHGFGDPLK